MLHIKTGGEHNVSLQQFDGFTELVLQVCVADVLGCLAELTQHLFEATHTSDYGTFKDISHLTDLQERGALGPREHDVHQRTLELAHILVFIHVHLRVLRYLRYSTGVFLQLSQHPAQLVAGGGGLRGVLVAHEAAHQRRALLRRQGVEHAVEYQLR